MLFMRKLSQILNLGRRTLSLIIQRISLRVPNFHCSCCFFFIIFYFYSCLFYVIIQKSYFCFSIFYSVFICYTFYNLLSVKSPGNSLGFLICRRPSNSSYFFPYPFLNVDGGVFCIHPVESSFLAKLHQLCPISRVSIII